MTHTPGAERLVKGWALKELTKTLPLPDVALKWTHEILQDVGLKSHLTEDQARSGMLEENTEDRAFPWHLELQTRVLVLRSRNGEQRWQRARQARSNPPEG